MAAVLWSDTGSTPGDFSLDLEIFGLS